MTFHFRLKACHSLLAKDAESDREYNALHGQSYDLVLFGIVDGNVAWATAVFAAILLDANPGPDRVGCCFHTSALSMVIQRAPTARALTLTECG